jgi:hypothetical protein
MRLLPALPIIALSFATACDNTTTAPDANQLRPSFQEGPSDQECVGFLPSGTYQNVFVPPGQSCTMFFTTVRGNLKVLEGSSLNATGNTVQGSVQADKSSFVRFERGFVGGSIQVKELARTELFPFAFVDIRDNTVMGNIQIQKNVMDNAASAVLNNRVVTGGVKIEDNTFANLFVINSGGQSLQIFNNTGSLDVFENRVGQNLEIFKNTGRLGLFDNRVEQNLQIFENSGDAFVATNMVGHDMQVLKNTGSAVVVSNTVEQTLQCFDNRPTFVGGPNAARKAEGQCFVGPIGPGET